MRGLRADWAARYCAAFEPRWAAVDPRAACRVLHGIAVLRHTPPPEWTARLLGCVGRHAAQASPQDTSMALWALARLRHKVQVPAALAAALCARAEQQAGLLDERELAVVLWSVARLAPLLASQQQQQHDHHHHERQPQHPDDEGGPLPAAAPSSNGSGAPRARQEEAPLAGGAAGSGHGVAEAQQQLEAEQREQQRWLPASWRAAMLRRVHERLPRLSGLSLVLVVYALGLLGWRADAAALEQALGRALRERFAGVGAQGLGLLAYGLARVGHVPARPWLLAFHARLEAAGRGTAPAPEVLELVRAAYAVFGFRPPRAAAAAAAAAGGRGWRAADDAAARAGGWQGGARARSGGVGGGEGAGVERRPGLAAGARRPETAPAGAAGGEEAGAADAGVGVEPRAAAVEGGSAAARGSVGPDGAPPAAADDVGAEAAVPLLKPARLLL